jgi:predicted NBD/HSP70 family sugar kinase
MQEISTMQTRGSDIFKGQPLTIGLDLGDRSSYYCVLNAAGDVIVERKLPTTPQGMNQEVRWDATQPHRSGDRSALSVGQPAIDPTRS